MGVFREGYAFEAFMDGHVLRVPLLNEKPLPRWLGAEKVLFGHMGQARRTIARVNLNKLTGLSFDSNDRQCWFDMFDARGHSLRLLFGAAPAESEAAVLASLRQRVEQGGITVDRETLSALSG